jgi:hypothetical protein
MADKKPDKKGDKKPAAEGRAVEIIIAEIIIIAGLIIGLIALIAKWLDWDFSGGGASAIFISVLSSLQAIAIFISLLFVMGIIYARFKMGQVARTQKLKEKVKEVQQKKMERAASSENKKWKRVIEHVTSANPSDWRLSILEADILLGELLTKMGYRGESIGEQLKSAEESDFHTLELAWEAHKIRNGIAHEGSDFVLSQREAKRVIGLFEEVFKEFYYI